MGNKKEKKKLDKVSKKESKRKLKESKRLIHDIFQRLESGAPTGGVSLQIIRIPMEDLPDELKPKQFIEPEQINTDMTWNDAMKEERFNQKMGILPVPGSKPSKNKTPKDWYKKRGEIVTSKLFPGLLGETTGKWLNGEEGDVFEVVITEVNMVNFKDVPYYKNYKYYQDVYDWQLVDS